MVDLTELPDETVGQLADTFRLMGDHSRLRIILACMGEPIRVGDIATRLDLSQSLVSHHLRLLKTARVVRGERRGRQMFYALCDDHIERVVDDMLEHVKET